MTALAPAAVDRIVAIAARTASDADGEALTAARLLNRELARAGLRIDDLLRRALGVDAALHAHAAADDHRAMAAEALMVASIFSPTQRDFLRNMIAATWATDAQLSWLRDLSARGRAYRSATSGARAC